MPGEILTPQVLLKMKEEFQEYEYEVWLQITNYKYMNYQTLLILG